MNTAYVHLNKWRSLAKDYHDALIAYAQMTRPDKSGMEALLDRFMLDIQKTVKPKTYVAYSAAAQKLKVALIEFSPEQVRPMHIAQILDHYRDTLAMANTLRNVAKQVFFKGRYWGFAKRTRPNS
ncbi:MAG: hypothetical protein LBU46_01630 [Candidatus Accumulibacter sp.]|nr:hypothetical protein [Accumulibacter sp.]